MTVKKIMGRIEGAIAVLIALLLRTVIFLKDPSISNGFLVLVFFGFLLTVLVSVLKKKKQKEQNSDSG